MKCPRCGLFNPDSAERCDCGYDFKARTVEKAYFKQELPKDIKTFLIITIVANVLMGISVLGRGDPGRILFAIVWSVLVYWLYSQLVQKKNWARIALAVVTFPIGLIIVLSHEARLYCLQK